MNHEEVLETKMRLALSYVEQGNSKSEAEIVFGIKFPEEKEPDDFELINNGFYKKTSYFDKKSMREVTIEKPDYYGLAKYLKNT